MSAIVNTLGLSTSTEITLSLKGIGEIKNDLEQAGRAASNAAEKITEMKNVADAASHSDAAIAETTARNRKEVIEYATQLDVLRNILRSIESVYNSASFGNGMLSDSDNIKTVTESVNNLKQHVEEASKIKIGDSGSLEKEIALINQTC